MDLTETFLSREDVFCGRVLRVHVDRVRLPNGRESTREVADHPGGVTILALDAQDRVLLVEQYRYVFGRTMWELPAGKLEPNELPQEAALRELREETGAIPEEFIPFGELIVSPGCYGERLYCYLARGLRFTDSAPDEDEFLRVKRVPWEQVLRAVLEGSIQDAKTVAAVLRYHAVRGDRLGTCGS